MAPRPRPHSQPAAAIRRRKVWLPDLADRMIDTEPGEPTPVLPKTMRLLKGLERLLSADDLQWFQNTSPDRMASYRAVPEPNHPYLRFRIAEAEPAFLAFAGKQAPGFEVLEVSRAGFQHHWRCDLVRTFNEQRPLLGRLCGSSDAQDLVVEHLSLPILRKGRVREIRGWLLLGEDPATGQAGRLDNIAMFRRLERTRPVRLPATLSRPSGETTKLQEFLRVLRRRWGAGGKQGRVY